MVTRAEIDRPQIEAAIAAAERLTSGEIVVSIARLGLGNVERNARREFVRLGMIRTQERNGVLVFVVPSRRRFAVLGDEGIHAHVGQEFWDATVAAIRERFVAGDLTGGIIRGVETIGAQLARYFPPRAHKVNELPNTVR